MGKGLLLSADPAVRPTQVQANSVSFEEEPDKPRGCPHSNLQLRQRQRGSFPVGARPAGTARPDRKSSVNCTAVGEAS